MFGIQFREMVSKGIKSVLLGAFTRFGIIPSPFLKMLYLRRVMYGVSSRLQNLIPLRLVPSESTSSHFQYLETVDGLIKVIREHRSEVQYSRLFYKRSRKKPLMHIRI